MTDHRQANRTMSVTTEDGSQYLDWVGDGVKLAALYDIRDELQILNRLLSCPSFTSMPATLRAIERHLRPRRKKKP
jgi:hypothetical protein